MPAEPFFNQFSRYKNDSSYIFRPSADPPRITTHSVHYQSTGPINIYSWSRFNHIIARTRSPITVYEAGMGLEFITIIIPAS